MMGKTPKTCVFRFHTGTSWWRTAPHKPTGSTPIWANSVPATNRTSAGRTPNSGCRLARGKLRSGYQQNIRRLTTRKALDQAMRLLGKT